MKYPAANGAWSHAPGRRAPGDRLATGRESLGYVQVASKKEVTRPPGSGEFHGYVVNIGKQGRQCYLWLMPGGTWTERCLRADSFGHAAWLARAWIEERGDNALLMPRPRPAPAADRK
jgi:hypothetical protein